MPTYLAWLRTGTTEIGRQMRVRVTLDCAVAANGGFSGLHCSVGIYGWMSG